MGKVIEIKISDETIAKLLPYADNFGINIDCGGYFFTSEHDGEFIRVYDGEFLIIQENGKLKVAKNKEGEDVDV